MAIGEADSREHRQKGLLSQPNEKGKHSSLACSVIEASELKPHSRQVSLAPYDLFSTLSYFSFSMPGGWNDQDLAVFLESCWENIEDLRKQDVDDNNKWKRIAEAGTRKSSNPTLFTINSCMEVAQCIKTYVIHNEERLRNHESFKKFHNDVINLLPYFPPVTAIDTHSTMNRSLVKPVANISEHVNEDDVLEKTLSQLILQNMSVIREGNPSIWETLSKAIHDRIAFNTDVQLFLELTKRKIISLVGKENDPQSKKDTFFKKTKKYMLEVFDYVAPLSVRKSDFLSPSEIDRLEDGNGDNISLNDNPLPCLEIEVASPNISCGNSISSNNIKQNSESESVEDITEPNRSSFEKEHQSDKKSEANMLDCLLDNVLSVKSQESELHKSQTKLHQIVLQKSTIPLKEVDVPQGDEPTNPSEEPPVSQLIDEPPIDKKQRGRKKKTCLPPSRILPSRTARPQVSMSIKRKYNSAKINHSNNNADETEQSKEIKRKKLKEARGRPKSVSKRKPEHQNQETSVRLVREVTTTQETVLRSAILSHSESSTNIQYSGHKSDIDNSPKNKNFVNKRIVTEEKVTTVVEASSFLKKTPIVRLIDICKDSRFQWPVQSQCTITTSDMSKNSNRVTVTKFKAEKISVNSIPKRKRTTHRKTTDFKESCSTGNSSDLDYRRCNCDISKPSSSHEVSQKLDRPRVTKTVVKRNKRNMNKTDSDTSGEGDDRPSRMNENRWLSNRNNSPESGSSDSEPLNKSSSGSASPSRLIALVRNQQTRESNLYPPSRQVDESQDPVDSLNKRPPNLTMLRKKWDELIRGNVLDVKGVSVEGLFARKANRDKDYWFEKYIENFNSRGAWRMQELRHEHNVRIQKERKMIEQFRNEVLPAIRKDINLFRNALQF